MQFIINVLHMGVHGVGADGEAGGNFLGGIPFGKFLQDFLLPS